MTKCILTVDGGGIAVQTPYDPGFVMELKNTIPYTDRKPKKNGKQFLWIVSPSYGSKVQDLCNKYFGELPLLPTLLSTKPTVKQAIYDVRYIGITKDRGTDDRSAYGWTNGGWNVIFPETVLRAWFDAPSQPDEQPNLYSVLGIKRDATEDEIKSGFRRMARQWHTDVCKEPNAHEQMLAINHAYEVLNNTDKRARYDAGLALEASLKNAPKNTDVNFKMGYRSPLRCGLIMVEGVESLGIFQVSKIYAWEDLHDNQGRTLVVSWPRGADHFTEAWA